MSKLQIHRMQVVKPNKEMQRDNKMMQIFMYTLSQEYVYVHSVTRVHL